MLFACTLLLLQQSLSSITTVIVFAGTVTPVSQVVSANGILAQRTISDFTPV
jgi:hypothetical protein